MKIRKDRKLLKRALSAGIRTAGELAFYLRTQQQIGFPAATAYRNIITIELSSVTDYKSTNH